VRLPLLALALPYLLASLAGCRCGAPGARSGKGGVAVEVIDPEELGRTTAAAEREPNDTRKHAQELPLEGGVEGTIGAGKTERGDADWYRVTVNADDQILTATLSGIAGLDLVLEAWSASARLMRVSNGKEGEGETLVNLAAARGESYLLVREAKGRSASGRYRLSYKLRPIEEGEEREPNYRASLASPLPLGGEATGYLGWHTDTDWYRVNLEGSLAADGARLRVEYDGLDEVRANLSLRTATGSVLQERSGAAGEPIILANLAAGEGQKELLVVVRCGYQANVETRYSIRVTSTVPPGPTEAEPNDTPATATPILPGTLLSGTLGDTADRDLYLVKASTPQSSGPMRVTVTPPLGLDVAVALLGEDGKPLFELDEGQAREPETIAALELRGGKALIQVRAPRRQSLNAVSPYRIRIDPLPAGRWEREPNATTASATPLEAGELRGFLHPKKDVDLFRLTGNGKVKLTVSAPRLQPRLKLGEAGGGTLGSAAADSTGTAVLEAELASGKEYVLELSDAAGASNPRDPYLIKWEAP
jgi:hypothetical protein